MNIKRFITAAVAVAALTTALTASSSAWSSGSHKTDDSKPTIVLVHGAWADSGSWDKVVARLQRAGYIVYAPSNPLRALDTDSESITNFLHSISGPIVLVGHSYGGAVITSAATGDSQVKALVYVDAFIPDVGQALTDLIHGGCFAVADFGTVFNFVPIPGAPAADQDTYVKQSVFPDCFANGLPAPEAQALAATQRPLATAALGAVSLTAAWKTIPSWAVVGLEDHVIPAADQLAMASNANAHVTEVKAPHLSMISDPEVVAGVIEDAAQATN